MVYLLNTAVRDEISLMIPRFWGRDGRIDLENLADYYKAQVIYVKFKESGLDGAVQKIENPIDQAYKIAISRDIPETRSRFTLAHEIGHIISDKCGSKSSDAFRQNNLIKDTEQILYRGSGDNNLAEMEANEIAAQLLMPAVLVKQYKEVHNIADEKISKLLGVSTQALVVRLANLGL